MPTATFVDETTETPTPSREEQLRNASLVIRVWETREAPEKPVKYCVVQVVKQQHRGSSFGISGSFVASNGLKLRSGDYPQMNSPNAAGQTSEPTEVLVWGTAPAYDKTVLFMTKSTYDRFAVAVKEYNKKFPNGFVDLEADANLVM